jgi:putative ABC transport system permease protein
MLRTRWYKVLIDLWRNRTRTLIVALAVAVGVYAVGTVLSIRQVLVREYESDHRNAHIAAAILYTDAFDDDLVDRIAEIPGVAAVEGRAIVSARIVPGTGAHGRNPRDLTLGVYGDYENIQVDGITPLEGATAPGKREILLERLSVDYVNAGIGDTLTIELDNGATRELVIAGIAHDPQVMAPSITDTAVGYITIETLDKLGLGDQYGELHIQVTGDPMNEANIQAIADRVEDHLERTGREVHGRRVITEGPVRPFIDTVVLLLTSFGAIVLLLAGFLVINAISALITQQVPQIGVMKLVGARRSQIMGMYIVTVLTYGIIAVLIGIPLAALTARFLMTGIVEPLVNVMPESYMVALPTIALQVAIGLLLPLLAGLLPVLKGTQVTTHQALNDVGMQADAAGRGWIEGIFAQLQRLQALQRPMLLAARNTLRHRGRLAQTLLVLVIGTALFISVLSVQASVDATLAGFMSYHQYDISVGLEQPFRTARLESTIRQLDGVDDVETWSITRTTRQRPDNTESESMRLYAVPPNSDLIDPVPSAGHWLGPERGIVINSDVVEEEADLAVGSSMVLDIGGREEEFRVAGIVPTESRGAAIYMRQDDYGLAARAPDKATHVLVSTRNNEPAAVRALESQLFDHFEAQGFEVSGTQTAQAINLQNEILFTVVVAFLILMALLLAAVGGLGLTTTMSINVMERVREIGVLRAIGASNVSVRRIVLAEGLVIAVVAWLVGTLLSVPTSRFMSQQVGLALIDVPLVYHYSAVAAVVWFFVLLIVAVVASLGPARSAVRLTVREVLAYE